MGGDRSPDGDDPRRHHPLRRPGLSPSAGTLTEMKALSIDFESAIISYCDSSSSCCSRSIGGKVDVTRGPT